MQQQTGQEAFFFNQTPLPFRVVDFWRWANSDLLSNTLRGILAEFIVAKALNIADTPRTEWDSVDLRTPSGLKIEVKSAAYLQSWQQSNLSKIIFDIAPKKSWHSETNTYDDSICRSADIYVFCLLHHKDKNTVNPLDLQQWTFYILPTATLDQYSPTQKKISLQPLEKLQAKKCHFTEIAQTITML